MCYCQSQMMFFSIRKLSPSLILEFKTSESTLISLVLSQPMIPSAFQHYLYLHLSFDSRIFLSQTHTPSYPTCDSITSFSCPHNNWKNPMFSSFTFRTFANRFIIKDSSRSSSSSKSSIGIPKGSMMLQHLEPSSLGSKGSTIMGSVPFISQRQKGQPWPSDSWTNTKIVLIGLCSNKTLLRGAKVLL